MMNGRSSITAALVRVGELLEAQGVRRRIVIIGGAAINLLGIVSRATTDVDILAFGTQTNSIITLGPPDEPLPADLRNAAKAVASDLGLDPHWLNTGPATQWKTGLPPGLAGRVHWQEFAGLSVGVVDRYDLIFFKLYAAVDDVGVRSVHFQDLVALTPSDDELEEAAAWVRAQDPSEVVANNLTQVIQHVRSRRD